MVQDSNLNVAFDPRSIAVVGASSDDKAEKVGWVGRLQEFGFKGKIYPINPKASVILGLTAYPSVKAVPEPIDYAIVSIRSSFVPGVLRDCIAKGVKVVHIFSAGFAETGMDEGKKLQEEVISIIKEARSGLSGRTVWVFTTRRPDLPLTCVFPVRRVMSGLFPRQERE